MTIKSEDLANFGIINSVQKSRTITKLKKKRILYAINEGGRIYTINFVNNALLRNVIGSLTKEGFISDFLNKNE